jgi:hypothetical protein
MKKNITLLCLLFIFLLAGNTSWATITVYFDRDNTGESGNIDCTSYYTVYDSPCVSGGASTATFASTTPRSGGGTYVQLSTWPYTTVPCITPYVGGPCNSGGSCVSDSDCCQCSYEMRITNPSGAYGDVVWNSANPVTLVSGRTYFMAVFLRLNRTASGMTNLFDYDTEDIDKELIMIGNNFRWTFMVGWPQDWYNRIDNQFTFGLNASYTGEFEQLRQNVSPYNGDDAYPALYERWYALVVAVEYNGASNGRMRMWVNGTNLYDRTMTVAGSSPTITEMRAASTWSQPDYDSPSRQLLLDRVMLFGDTSTNGTDGITYLTDRGYFSNPDSGSTTTTAIPSILGVTVTGGQCQ